MIARDSLRPPAVFDPSAAAYKDWLHVNFFDHGSDTVGLINVSLHGAPSASSSQAVGAALAFDRNGGWHGNVAVRPMREAGIGLSQLALDRVAIGMDYRNATLHAAADFPDDQFALRLHAEASSDSVAMEQMLPLGPGWISWYVIPRLSLSGTLTCRGQTLHLERASGYHDHNWGRWFWGQDFGWEWGSFVAPAPGPSFVLARVTDRSHEHIGRSYFTVHHGHRQHRFPALGVTIDSEFDELDGITRLPGAQAALHQSRRRPSLPGRMRIRARDGGHRVDIDFRAWDAAQLITADPAFPGYGFIHEIAGRFDYRGRLGDELLAGSGLAMVEHVS